MPYNPDLHHRRSIRLKGYNYSQAGSYFITICVKDRLALLGNIMNEATVLSQSGKIVQNHWGRISSHFSSVRVDEYVLMPNHLHGILTILDSETKPVQLGKVIQGFKAFSTKAIQKVNLWEGVFWQRNYYEHIIRDEQDLLRIQTYIAENPMKWEVDTYHIEEAI